MVVVVLAAVVVVEIFDNQRALPDDCHQVNELATGDCTLIGGQRWEDTGARKQSGGIEPVFNQ